MATPPPRRLAAATEIPDVRDILFDVDFSTPSDAASDQAFVEALRSAGESVVLPSFEQPGAADGNGTAVHINRPLKQFGDHSWTAVVNVAVERDGLVRRFPFGENLDGQFLPSMDAVLAGQHNREARAISDRFRHPYRVDSESVLH